MIDPQRTDKSRSESDKNTQKAAVDAPVPAESAGSKTLTPEEQMAAFEKDLKENDWGHQPC